MIAAESGESAGKKEGPPAAGARRTLNPTQRTLLAALLMAALIWLPRGLALDRFVTADEHAWLARSANFYRALTHGDFAAAFQRHHPGVTVTWAGLAGFLTAYPSYAQDAPGYFGWLTEEIEPFLRSQGYDPVELLAAGRAFVVLSITISLTLAFVLAVRLFGLWPAAAGFVLIAFSPFHIAHSRLLHLDGMVSSFMFLALMAFLVYLQERRLYALILSAAAAGLAWLTRSPALFLLPFMAALALGAWAFPLGHSTAASRNRSRSSLGRPAGMTALWALFAVVTFVLLWPAMWVDPLGSLRQVIDAAGEYAVEGHLKPTFYAGEVYAGDPGFSFYPVTYLWRTTPVVLLGLALALVAYAARRPPFDRPAPRFAAATLALYAVGFLLFMNLGAKKFDRYLLPSYLPLALIAGGGIVALGTWLSERRRARFSRRAQLALLALLLVVQAALALAAFPYYLSYYNPLLGGAARAPQTMMIGWGEGADEAARFLNTLPDADRLIVASGYTNGPFSYFFRGKTVPITFWHEADYAIVYAQDWQRQLPSRRAVAHFSRYQPVHVIQIDGLDYAHIYELRQMPLPDYVTDWDAAIRLVSYQLPAASISPGESFRAIFYFVNLAPIDSNLNVLVRIVGPDGQELSRNEGWPWGAATSSWQRGVVWPDGHDLAIPTGAVPGYYRVEAGFYDPSGGELLDAVLARTGEPAGDLVTLDYIRVGEPPTRPAHPLTPPADLGGLVQLTGADWRAENDASLRPDRLALQPGEALTVTLFWQALQPMDVDYTAFVHVVGPDGAVVAQADGQPLNGFMPASAWLPKQVVADKRSLRLPADAAPGDYTIYAGLYDLATMQRLPVTRDGEPSGDVIPLATLTVRPAP